MTEHYGKNKLRTEKRLRPVYSLSIVGRTRERICYATYLEVARLNPVFERFVDRIELFNSG
ncbi:hypothetical protein D3C86_1892220 [compost metagenome]